MARDGLISLESQFSVEETINRLAAGAVLTRREAAAPAPKAAPSGVRISTSTRAPLPNPQP